MHTYPDIGNLLPSQVTRLKNSYHKKIESTMENDQYNIFKVKPIILIVEDAPILQLVFKKLLELMGCEIELTKNGFKAIKMFNEKYLLILLDIKLSIMDSIETAIILRAQKQAKQIPIIGMNAYDE